MFKRVLVANRGEIAVRIIRTLKEMGIESVAIYSEADKEALHTLAADYAFDLGGNRSADTYMNIQKIIGIAMVAGVDAIHPGYGFLSENPKFAEAVEKAGIAFIGPKSKIISLMGDKVQARKLMLSMNVPVVMGSEGGISSFQEAKDIADKIGFPLIIKSSAGGGGMGMAVVRSVKELKDGLEAVQNRALKLFGNSEVFVEKYIESPRHIEVQVIGDKHGNYVHLGERECSIQRRHQKILEETPCVAITPELREEMCKTAISIAAAVGYCSAGTVEFIYDNGKFYFLEMNTRIQVEHTITEMVTGIDIVRMQIEIAQGEVLSFTQKDVNVRGHAIECRICAEDPFNSFVPSPAIIHKYIAPGGFGIRLDAGVYSGYEISSFYDSMAAKLICWGETREEAIKRMFRALSEYIIEGPATNISLLLAIIENEAFKDCKISTKFLDEQKAIFEEALRHKEKNIPRISIKVLT